MILKVVLTLNYSAVRKVNPDGTIAWLAAVTGQSQTKSLSVDKTETNVYLGIISNPFVIVSFATTTGSITFANSM